MDPDLERLRFLLAGLQEPAPSKEAERRAVTASRRHWLPTIHLGGDKPEGLWIA